MSRLVRRLAAIGLAIGFVLAAGLGLAAYLADIPGLIRTYQPQLLAVASKALNRPVEVGSIGATWFPTLGLEVEGLRIGDDPLTATSSTAALPPPSGRAFVSLGKIEVGVAVWPALVSLGKDLRVTHVRLVRPEILVARAPDGTFNFSTLGGPKTEPEPEPEPESSAAVTDWLEKASIGEIAIVDGVVRYEDATPGGLGALDVRRIGFMARNVGLGLPIEAVLTAALRGGEAEPNLRVELATGPLATKIAELGAPEPQRLGLWASGVPLSIVPVESAAVRLVEAALSADVKVEPAPGGGLAVTGPLSVAGLRLTQAGVAPGAAFDVALGLAVKTSTAFDAVALDGTQLAVGALRAAIAGRVRFAPDLRWDDLRIGTAEAFSVRELLAIAPGPRLPVPAGRLAFDLTTGGALEALRAKLGAQWSGLEHAQAGLAVKGSAGLDVSVRGSASAPDVDLGLDLGAVDVRGDGFAKPAGLATGLTTTVQVRPAEIRVPALALVLGDARLSGQGVVPLGDAGRVDFQMALEKLLLEPFLTKLALPAASLPPGSALGLEVRYQASAASPAAGSIQVPKLDFSAGESALVASAAVETLSPLVARIEGRSPYLNLDALLPKSGGAEPPPAEPTDPNAPLLPESMRSARITTDLEVKKLVYAGIDLTDVDVLLELRGGKLDVKTTRVGLFGGRFVADGTSLDLATAPLGYDLVAKLEGLEGKSLFDMLAHVGGALTGRLDSEVKLSGRGFAAADLARSLSGAFSVALTNGRLDGVDLISSTVLPLRDALAFANKTAATGAGKELVTGFERLAGSFSVEDGQLRLTKPMKMKTSRGELDFEGGMGLDGKLAFKGTFAVPPALLGQLTDGKVKPKEPVPVRFGLGCTITKPCVEGVDAGPAAELVTKLLADKAAGLAAAEIEKRTGIDATKAEAAAKEVARDAEAAAKKAEEEARRRAEEEAARLEAEAEAAAQEAKKKAAEQAKKKLKGLFK